MKAARSSASTARVSAPPPPSGSRRPDIADFILLGTATVIAVGFLAGLVLLVL